MSRISSQLAGLDLIAQNNLSRAQSLLQKSSQRLSTLSRINRGSDDPAGLISAENLRSELVSLEQAGRNADRASSFVRVADSGLSQINNLLNTIRGNVIESAGNTISDAGRAANQLEIDAALDAINRIGRSTALGGKKLLDGSASFQTEGVKSDQFTNFEVTSRGNTASTSLSITVDQEATAAQLRLSSASGDVATDLTLVVSGADGSATLDLAAGASFQDVADAVNANTENTGATAEVVDGEVVIASADVGSDATVTVSAESGSIDGTGTASGTDVVVTVNGQEFTGEGNDVRVNTENVQVEITVAAGFSGEAETITVSGDALSFLFSANPQDAIRLALPNVSTATLGSGSGSLDALRSGGSASLRSGNAATTISILDGASASVLRSQARAGAFERFTIDSSREVLSRAEENVSAALSRVADTDVAKETSRLIRAQILTDASINSIRIAGSRRRSISDLFNLL